MDSKTTTRDEDLTAGALLAGRYQLMQRLGQSDLAVVWRALDTTPGEEVAIKILRSKHARNVIQRSRFEHSATVMASIKHNAVVKVLAQNTDDAGSCFFVMELIRGGTDFRKAVVRKEVQLEQATSLILRVGAALAELHSEGLVHRNLRPENILLDTSLAPRLIDFDLFEDDDHAEHNRSAVYVAPEMLHDPGSAGAASDVYSLAMMLVFAIRGTEPQLSSVRDGTLITSLPCDHTLKNLLNKALDTDPLKRFRDAKLFCDALSAITQATRSQLPLTASSEFGDALTYLPPERAEFEDGPTRLPTPSTDFDYEHSDPSVVMGAPIGTDVLDEIEEVVNGAATTEIKTTATPPRPSRPQTAAVQAEPPAKSNNQVLLLTLAILVLAAAIAGVLLIGR